MIVREKEEEEGKGKLRRKATLLGYREVRRRVFDGGKAREIYEGKRIDEC